MQHYSFQFDKNVVTHYQNQEQIFDYIFTRLGINADACVPHPVVLTECYVNPNYCRQCKFTKTHYSNYVYLLI